MELDLEGFLRSLDDREEALFLPNPGNGGDSFIAAATLQVLRRLGVRHRFVGSREVPSLDGKGRVVLLGGGGNLVPYYSDVRRRLALVHGTARRVVLLPHTIAGNEDLLGALGGNVDLVARDVPSYEHARRHAAGARVWLAHDMTLYASVPELLRRGRESERPVPLLRELAREAVSARHVIRGRLRAAALRLRRPGFPPTGTERGSALRCFRQDAEARTRRTPRGNADLSALFGWGAASEAAVEAATYHLLRALEPYEEVHTDRLHVALARAAMGKRVHLYPTNTPKVEAVYRHSIRGRFPGVIWMGDGPG